MDRLFAGPLASEKADGLRLLRSRATGYADLALADGVARVRLTGGCNSDGSTVTVAGEIMPTLRQFPSVDWVKIFDPAGSTGNPTGNTDSIPAVSNPDDQAWPRGGLMVHASGTKASAGSRRLSRRLDTKEASSCTHARGTASWSATNTSMARSGTVRSSPSNIQDGSPPYRVRWSDNGHESLFFPGPDAYIHHADGPASSAPDNG